MPRRRTDPNRCANGHDLSSDRNRYRLPSGKVECRQCRAEVARRLRGRQAKTPERLHAECRQCGRRKWRDRRHLCFACAKQDQPKDLDAYFADVVELESAPAYVRRDPEEQRRWLRQHRTDPSRLT